MRVTSCPANGQAPAVCKIDSHCPCKRSNSCSLQGAELLAFASLGKHRERFECLLFLVYSPSPPPPPRQSLPMSSIGGAGEGWFHITRSHKPGG